jgi:hypothetical protein
MMDNNVHIKEPFYTAGNKYNWIIKYNPLGVGIDLAFFTGEGKIMLTVGGSVKKWQIEKIRARELVKEYNSFYNVPNKKMVLGVLPLEAFEEIE